VTLGPGAKRSLAGAGDRVRAGDEINVVPAPPARSDAVAEAGIAFDVLYVDEDVVVLDKPAGLVVHPARGHASGTLVNGLLARGFFQAGELGDPDDAEGHLRPGIVHRLDAGTSGVMVVARTAAAREGLKTQFQAHSIERAYEAICVGHVEPRTHATLHGRHPKDRLRFTTRVREGKRAVTQVEVCARFGAIATHVRCRLETGRTHQIRVHLSESGTPILGDALYGKPPRNPALRKIAEELGHQALAARVLGFTHPRTKERLRFEVPLPSDFRRALSELAHLERRP
jgi:23S rRNA pseudouridine1911/1915/1917 synthase